MCFGAHFLSQRQNTHYYLNYLKKNCEVGTIKYYWSASKMINSLCDFVVQQGRCIPICVLEEGASFCYRWHIALNMMAWYWYVFLDSYSYAFSMEEIPVTHLITFQKLFWKGKKLIHWKCTKTIHLPGYFVVGCWEW